MDLLEVIKAQRSDLLSEEDTIIASSPKAGLKPDAKARLGAIHVEIADLDAKAAAERARQAHVLSVPAALIDGPSGGSLFGTGGGYIPGRGTGGRGWDEAGVGAQVIDAINARGTGIQAALVSGGSVPVAIPLRSEVVSDPRAAKFVADIIPGQDAPGGHFSYLQQTVRTNNAGPVPKGTRKPTSIYTVERVDDHTKTIAHLSEPVPRQDLDDAALLTRFLDDELTYGLRLAVDAQILSGDGTSDGMTGILDPGTGIASQAFATDALITTRKAITQLQVLDLAPDFFVFTPRVWEDIELEAAAQFAGNPNQPSPVDAMTRRLWGVGVVVSNSMPADTGLLGAFAAGSVLYQTGGVRIDFSENVYRADLGDGQPGTDFEANQVTFRAEGRWGLGILLPAAFVSIDLPAEGS